MSIPVTCPECHAHFHVDDEFAGRAGRCPECAAILQVPGPADEPEPVDSNHPYGTPHYDHMPAPAPTRRRDERSDREHPARGKYDEPQEPRFDPHARAARWIATSRGLRNVMIAIVLATINMLVIAAFVLTDEIKPGPPQNFIGRDIALWFGTTVVAAIYMMLWMAGRLACARVPYVPARGAAVPAAIIAGLAGGCGILSLGMSAIGILMVQQGNLNGAGFVVLGSCGLMPAGLGYAIAEVIGLWSQVQMADGLRDRSFGRLSRTLFAGTLVAGSLALCGGCGLFIIMTVAEQKAQQQMQQQKQGAPAEKAVVPGAKGPDAPADGKNSPPAKDLRNEPKDNAKKEANTEKKDGKKEAKKDEKKDEAPAAGNGNPAGNQPPPPDPADVKAVTYAMAIIGMLIALIYAGLSIACFQSGRRAIRHEVARLIGDPHDHHPDGHF